MRDLESRTYYELLGLEADASTEQIKEAYREIARIYHPDSNFYSDIIEDDATNEDSDVFKAITSAYQVLISEEKRRAYDDSLPKNLDAWGEDEEHYGTAPHQPEEPSHTQRVRRPTEEIPEEWRKEREYFEAHYEEILRPAPKADLVGSGGELPATQEENVRDGQYETWDDSKTFIPGSRFGDLDVDGDLKIPSMIAPTRRVVKHGAGFGMDPMAALMYLGIPALLTIVLIELYLFM